MGEDGRRSGYDLEQLSAMRGVCRVPLVASGGAGCLQDFANVFTAARVDAALAAGVFHRGELSVGDVKAHLARQRIPVRPTEVTAS